MADNTPTRADLIQAEATARADAIYGKLNPPFVGLKEYRNAWAHQAYVRAFTAGWIRADAERTSK